MVRSVMFRSRTQLASVTPRVGDQVELLASVSLYEARGDYQLLVDALRPAGRGDLYEAFLRIKQTLQNEGLFDAAYKRPLMTVPRRVGIVTSLAAAALQDVLTTLTRRAPHVGIIIYPSIVQGQEAAPALQNALRQAISRNEVDTLLVVRGGGSMEDLWCFNDETLARAIAASPIPVVTGVGHETDFTIADFVADQRAPTPTAAAEIVCRAREACIADLAALQRRLNTACQRTLDIAAMRLDRLRSSLISPAERLRQQQEHVRSLAHRMTRAEQAVRTQYAAHVNSLYGRLVRCPPAIERRRGMLDSTTRRLHTAAREHTRNQHQRLHVLLQALQAMDPHGVLARGYAIVRDADQNIVKNALDLKIGETLSVEFDRGTAQVDVLRTHALL